MDFQIIESGYATDYLYSILISLFNNGSQGCIELINKDFTDPQTIYIKELIQSKIIDSLHYNQMIESKIINRLRVFLYNAGWLREKSILTHASVEDFYKFFIAGLMDYNLQFSIINLDNNMVTDIKVPYIVLDELKDGNLSNGIERWMEHNLGNENNIYTFKELPLMVPILIETNDGIDLMEAIRFNSINDKLQKILIWEIYSLICLDEKGYYCIIKNKKGEWILYRDGEIPSNQIIIMHDVNIAEKIKKEIKLCFYWKNF